MTQSPAATKNTNACSQSCGHWPLRTVAQIIAVSQRPTSRSRLASTDAQSTDQFTSGLDFMGHPNG